MGFRGDDGGLGGRVFGVLLELMPAAAAKAAFFEGAATAEGFGRLSS